jgi:hypothetical protein
MIEYTEITRESGWDGEKQIYIRAKCEIVITPKGYEYGIVQRLSSGGLYGIDDGSSREYLDEAWLEERQTLLDMLNEIGAIPRTPETRGAPMK